MLANMLLRSFWELICFHEKNMIVEEEDSLLVKFCYINIFNNFSWQIYKQ